MKRVLDWKPIEEAPNMQKVLIWAEGEFFKGHVKQYGNGGYDVFPDSDETGMNASHYAIIEGP